MAIYTGNTAYANTVANNNSIGNANTEANFSTTYTNTNSAINNMFRNTKDFKDVTSYRLMRGVPDFGSLVQFNPYETGYAAFIICQMPKFIDDVAMMREQYNQRRRYLLHRFKEMGLECFEPFGAFYVFPCIKEFGMTSDEFATELLKSRKVAVVPGTAFGDSGEGFVRISYAYSIDNLRVALDRIEGFITELREKNNG